MQILHREAEIIARRRDSVQSVVGVGKTLSAHSHERLAERRHIHRILEKKLSKYNLLEERIQEFFRYDRVCPREDARERKEIQQPG